MRIARVFPRKTKATPKDALAFTGPPDLFASADEVHISVAFTEDKPKAERLAEQWERIAPVKIGGPAYMLPEVGDPFVPGLYVRPGYTFTSRGCPRSCWFCRVHRVYKRQIHELPIQDGWNVLDDNLLACSRPHVEAVFRMLQRVGRERRKRVEFTGGLEALSLEDYQVGLLADLKPRPNCFFAYDPQDAFETLESAASRLLAAALLRPYRSSPRQFRGSDQAADRHGSDRLHANGNALEPDGAERRALATVAGLARVSAALGATGHHPRKARFPMRCLTCDRYFANGSHGNCANCAKKHRKAITAGQTTWEQLAAEGKAVCGLARRNQERVYRSFKSKR